MNVLLDTCALLWLAAGDDHLSPKALARIEEAGLVYVSVLSGFEVALKARRGKLRLPATPDEWFHTTIDHHGLTILPLALDDALRAPQLPDIHRDPCDRFMIASALRLAIPVATADSRFAEYGVATFC